MQFDLMSFKVSPVDDCSGCVVHQKHTKNLGCFTQKVRIPPALKPVKTRSSSHGVSCNMDHYHSLLEFNVTINERRR